MEEVDHDPVKGLADEELRSKLKLRHRMSEGTSDAHCFIHNGSSRDGELCGDDELRQRYPLRTFPDECERVSDMGATAQHSPAPSVDLCSAPSELDEITAAAAEDEADKAQYEWQFDILSSFPRDKALALVEHLRRSERERAKASAAALRLQRTNSTLEKQLDAAMALLREKGPASPRLAKLLTAVSDDQELSLEQGRVVQDWRSRLWWCCLAVLLGSLAIVLLPVSSDPTAEPLQGSQTLGSTVSANATPPLPTLGRITGQLDFQQQATAHAPGAHCRCAPDNDSVVRETTVREMTLRETTTREFDAEAVARMSQEHEAMKGQLERLWMDIDVAMQRNQDMVCWKL